MAEIVEEESLKADGAPDLLPIGEVGDRRNGTPKPVDNESVADLALAAPRLFGEVRQDPESTTASERATKYPATETFGVRHVPNTERGGNVDRTEVRVVPAVRRDVRERGRLAVGDLRSVANQSAGLTIDEGPGSSDVIVSRVGRKRWTAQVVSRRSVSPAQARALLDNVDGKTRAGAGQTPTGEQDEAHIVVADEISAEAKEVLAAAPGWGWLDQRGELRLRHGDTEIEIRFTPEPTSATGGVRLARPASDGPIRGRGGIGVAAALLVEPERPLSIRAAARALGMAPSTVSEAAGHLRDAGLILPSGLPALPDLFWFLAEVWQPTAALPVAEAPDPSDTGRDDPALDGLGAPGWSQGGDEAAMAWGAPMLVSGSRPWIWVPDEATARRAQRRLGVATWEDAAAVIAVPPSTLASTRRANAPDHRLPWPTPDPVFLALELAQDRARGHQILDEWHPAGHPRPWADDR